MNEKVSVPPSLATAPSSPPPRAGRRGLVLLLVLAVLLLAGASGAGWWILHRQNGKTENGVSSSQQAGTQPRKEAAACSDDDDPKVFEPFDFGPPIETPFEGRFLTALSERPIPPVEVYPWLPKGLVAILGEHRMRGNLVAVSPDGKWLAVARSGSGYVRLGKLSTLHETTVLPCRNGVLALAWSPQGDQLAVSGADNVIRCHDVRDPAAPGEPVALERSPGGITLLSFSGDGKYILANDTTPDTSSARIWDISTRKIIRKLSHSGPVAGVAFSPVAGDYRALTAGGKGDSRLCLWNALSGEELACVDFSPKKKVETINLGPVAFSPDGKQALSSHPDMSIRVWDLARLKADQELQVLKGHGGDLPLATFSPDGRLIATARFNDGGLWLWDAQSGKQVRRVALSSSVGAMHFLPGGERLIFSGSLGYDWNVHLHEVASGTEILPPVGHLAEVTGVALSPGGRRIASAGNDATGRLWDVQDGKQHHAVGGHVMMGGVSFHPADKLACFFSVHQGTVAFVDVESGASKTPAFHRATGGSQPAAGHNGGIATAALSRDGRYAVTGGSHDASVRVWRLQDGREMRVFALDSTNQGLARVTLAPDMRRAIGIGGGATRLLQLRCQQEVHKWPTVGWAPFLPDGRAVFLGGPDAPLWRIKADEVREDGRFPLNLSGVVGGHISADGKRVAALIGSVVAVHELETGRRIWEWTPPPHFGGIAGVALAPEGGHLLTANGDGTVYVVRMP